MSTDPTTTPVPPTSTPRERRPRMRLAAAALVVVGILGFAGVACTPEEVATVAVSNYFEPADRACALRIIERESGYQADAVNPYSGTIGLFQIHPVHTNWVRNTFGYRFSELTSPNKNAEVARGLAIVAALSYGDRWQPWRPGGQIIRGGGCPV